MKLDFINRDFLLETEAASELFHSYAEGAPVVDYHNHLEVKDICDDRHFGNIGLLWVAEDKYKHRAMRMAGVDEEYISGKASDYEKFLKWCQVLPRLVGNPLFHWSCFEMKQIFGVDELPCSDNADQIWTHCNSLLQKEEFSNNAILRRFSVRKLTTSDDFTSDISLHRKATAVSGIDVTPSLRADSALAFGSDSFASWLDKLSGGRPVDSLDCYLSLLSEHLDLFDQSGCRLADHALDNGFRFIRTSRTIAQELFSRVMDGEKPDLTPLRSFLLEYLAEEYGRRSWVMQLHIGAERWTSSRLRKLSGPAGGYACPGNSVQVNSLCDFLDALDCRDRLPGVILYTLNPADNAILSTMTGSFATSGRQKIQFGPAWWYNDHKCGIEENLAALSSYSILSNSIGMTTDSRTILSFSRHEYFRRILCNWFGGQMTRGELPSNLDFLGQTVLDIAYRNALKWIYAEK